MMMPVSSLDAAEGDCYSYAHGANKPDSECSSVNIFVNSLDQQLGYPHTDNQLKVTEDSSNFGPAYLTSKSGNEKVISVEEPVQVMCRQANNSSVDLSNLQPWKNVLRRTQQELEELSVAELQQLLEILHVASQEASLCLVSLLQSRHSLEEQLELRNIAIEQLLRLAEKHIVVSCPPASPGMTGRG